MVRWPEMSGNACTHTGDGGTPTKHSVPVGRSDCRYIPQSWSAFAVFKIKSMDPATSFMALDSRLLTKLCAPSARASCSLPVEVEGPARQNRRRPWRGYGDGSPPGKRNCAYGFRSGRFVVP